MKFKLYKLQKSNFRRSKPKKIGEYTSNELIYKITNEDLP